MDGVDIAIIAALRRDARTSLSEIAEQVGVSRATVRARLDRLVGTGEIEGFTVVLKGDHEDPAVRAVMLIEVEGKGADDVVARLRGMPEMRAIHTTNGRWDLVAEIAAPDLPAFDDALRRIRLVRGISSTETNILLSTRKRAAPPPRR